MPANIFIVEDNPMIQKLLSKLLSKLPNMHVCGTAATAQEALALLPEVEANLLLIDISLPDMSGIDLVSILHSRQPELRCLMLSGYQEPTYVKDALAAGAQGYLVKGAFYELTDAIRQVLIGKVYLSSQVRSGLMPLGDYTRLSIS